MLSGNFIANSNEVEFKLDREEYFLTRQCPLLSIGDNCIGSKCFTYWRWDSEGHRHTGYCKYFLIGGNK